MNNLNLSTIWPELKSLNAISNTHKKNDHWSFSIFALNVNYDKLGIINS